MSHVPFSVSRFLYRGIIDEIKHLQRIIEFSELTEYEKQKLIDLEEAIQWYKENCMVSSEYLQEEWQNIKNKL